MEWLNYNRQLLHLASNRNFCFQCIWFVLDVIDANKSAILFYSVLFYSILFHSTLLDNAPLA